MTHQIITLNMTYSDLPITKEWLQNEIESLMWHANELNEVDDWDVFELIQFSFTEFTVKRVNNMCELEQVGGEIDIVSASMMYARILAAASAQHENLERVIYKEWELALSK